MKHILSLLIALLLMAGCHRPATGELCTELQQAEALMYPNPDSSLHILQTMDVPGDELNRATWALFTTQAKYKLLINQSDSLLNVAASYFNKSKMPQRRALILYHQAGLKKEKKEYEEAQNLLLEATTEVEKTDDYQLAHLVYASLGGIYVYRSLLEYSLSTYNKAYEYALKSGNQKQVIASLVYLGRTYGVLRDIPKAIDYYKQAANLAKETPYHEIEISTLNELAGIYNRGKDFQSALMYMNEVLELCSKYSIEVSPQDYVVLGETYKSLNKTDSAEFYLKKALSTSNIYTRRGACLDLFYLYKKNGNFKDAALFLEQSWKLHDSITKLDKSRILIEMQEKYDQQKVKDEAAMEIRLQKQRTQTTIGIIIVVILLAGVYARHRYRRRIARLAEAEDRIDTLTRMLEEAQQATGEDDAFVKRMLLQQLGVIRLVANTPTAQNQALLRRLAEIGNDQVPVEELIVWKDLYPLIDRLYNGFHSRLTERFGSVLTNKEVQICCLLCAGFSTKEISVITHQSSGTVYVRKTSIRKKLGIEEAADIVEAVKAFDDTH